jgi:hypothetical protein
MKSEPETSAEYKAFKSLLNRVMAVPRSVIEQREEEYKRRAALNPNKRGPKPSAVVKDAAKRKRARAKKK